MTIAALPDKLTGSPLLQVARLTTGLGAHGPEILSAIDLHLDAGDDRFRLPTTAQFFPHPRGVLLRNWLRGGQVATRARAAAIALGPGDWHQRLLRLLHEARARDGVFHLWGHSWEIEQFGLWSALDELLKEAARLVPPGQRRSNGALVDERFGTTV